MADDGDIMTEKKLLVFGDSLVAGYGLQQDQSFPAQLGKKLKADGHNVAVIGAGVSGETSSGGLTRLEWVLDQHQPDWIIIVLGANDMMRAIDVKVTRDNFVKMMDILKARKIPVLLAGMKSFRNMSDLFGSKFEDMYEDMADDYDAILYPFFLEDVAMKAELNIYDGIHPNEKGIGIIVDNIYDDVEDLLEKGQK